MAVIEIDKDPAPSTLRWFGVVVLAFFCLVAAIAWWQGASLRVVVWLCGAGTAIALLYYLLPPLRRPLYLGWMYLVYPIGWTVSHVLLALVFYGVITPIGLALRLFGRDPMRRKWDSSRVSYWIPKKPTEKASRYFRQF
jgi:hypothetical protein